MKISKLEVSKHKKGRILVFLEDDTLLKITEREVIDFDLYKGRELDAPTLAALRAAADNSTARARAVEMISRRPMSKKQIRDKLRDKDVSPADAEDAADWLEEIGALNEREFASMVVRHYSEKGYGRAKIKDEFYKRGVPRELWDEALEEIPDSAAIIDRLIASKLRMREPSDKEIKRISDGLRRRGFAWSDIREALGRLDMNTEDCEE